MSQVKFFWQEPIDVRLIAESWEAAFRRPFSHREWDWRFGRQMDKNRILAAYVLQDGKVACFVAHSTVEVVAPDGSMLKSALMLMGFTHPDYRGRGLFTLMSRAVNAELGSLGYDFIFAFANNNSHYTNRRNLNWKDVGILTNFTLEISASKPVRPETSFSAAELPLDGALLNQLEHFCACREQYHLNRSKDYLNWRILQHPTRNYRAIGITLGKDLRAVAIYKLYESDQLDIMEIFYAEESDLASEQILSALVSFLSQNGVSKLNIWSNLFASEHLCLEKLGFAEDGFSAYFGLIQLSDKPVSVSLADWHYRFLDSDVY